MSFFRFCAPESHSQVRILMFRKWLFINYNGSEKLTYRNKHDTSTKITYYVYFSEKGRAKYANNTRCATVERLLSTPINTTRSICF